MDTESSIEKRTVAEKRGGRDKTSTGYDEEKAESDFNYFTRPQSKELDMFFRYHPKQEIQKTVNVHRVFHRKDGSNRKWLTYCEQSHSLYCTVCLAFSKPSYTSAFVKGGMNTWSHVYLRIEEHEQSVTHRESADAYFLRASKADIESLLSTKQMSAHQEQVRKRRQVLERVINVVKVIGKRGLSYRAHRSEAAFNLEDVASDHGNFLELILLLSKYDVCLQEHVSDCKRKSKKLHDSGGRGGRGSLVTLLSKTTVHAVIDTISRAIKETIAKEVREAGMFSVQLDTTQDVTSKEQCSVILRYVTDAVHERLIAVVECEKTTGEAFVKLLAHVLEEAHLDISKCVGNATDGAANMQGKYQGFSALLSEQSENQVHIWCYAHVLNLVLAESTAVVMQSATLFSVLNDIAVFIRESYKRMSTWEQVSEDPRHRRLSPIGETRWWAKDDALRKVFGAFGNPQRGLFVDLIVTLTSMGEDTSLKPTARVKAEAYKESLLKYETILTAQVFLRIFEHTSPLSKYMQTKGMDILTVQRLVVGTQESLKKCARDFRGVQRAADQFVVWANEKLQDHADCEVEVQAGLPEKRVKKKKAMAGELAVDETPSDPASEYEIKVHNVILDTVAESIKRRFQANGAVCSDFAYMDPRNFADIREKGIQTTALESLSKYLIKFDDRATVETLQAELRSLAEQWETLKMPPLQGYHFRGEEPDDDGEGEPYDEQPVIKTCTSCKNCAICCFRILNRYNLLTDAYSVLGLAYKFLLTLSVTQVACERSFSTLKFIKSRLRSTMSQDHLEAFMLMTTERETLMALDSDAVTDQIAERSASLRRLLTTT